ncbi:MAG: VWA domain-containing protein, partial [Planctomycetota bacterium]
MDQFGLAFDNPWWPFLMAILVILLVAMWVWSFRSLSGLGSYRRIFALVFRTAVLTLLMFALADVQLLRTNDGITVIYLLDQSASVPAEQRLAMLKYVVKEVEKNRDDAHGDRASVIVFGRQANIEVPPLDDDLPLYGRLESAANLRMDATNLEAAMKLAQATFPEDSSHRLVLISDGNENVGRAENIARQLTSDGVSIDVLPVQLSKRAEVAVERVALPGDIRKGTPFDATVVVNNLTPTTEDNPGAVEGTLKVVRRRGQNEETLSEDDVVLPPGKRVFRFSDEIEEPDFWEYAATFSPKNAEDDLLKQNNSATGFTYVRGKGHILLIEDWENRKPDGTGEFSYLVERLRANNLEVTVQFSDSLFSSLAELQRYDAVILGNVPRSSGTDADNLSNFSDDQVSMLVRNTQQMGCGLVMIGGPNSYGAGGWANTDLEKAMPVDFQIRNTKVQAVGALCMIMHASELAEGNYWQKVIGREALKSLGPQDYCGVVSWDSSTFKEAWLWGRPQGLIRVGGNRPRMVSRIDRMVPGDMPDFDPAMKIAAAAFGSVKQAAVKHMIIISDGDPSPPSGGVLSRLKNLGVKISTVAVGTHGPAGSTPLRRISTFTGGKYYVVRNPKALPRIYQREARRVARPLVVERDLQPQKGGWHEVMQGIDSMPPIKGFVMTTVKQSPLVEVPLLSPYPINTENATLLAAWQYGLGRTAVLTTDAGERWT